MPSSSIRDEHPSAKFFITPPLDNCRFDFKLKLLLSHINLFFVVTAELIGQTLMLVTNLINERLS